MRLAHNLETIYSEDDPTGQGFPGARTRVTFGGVLGELTSLVRMSPNGESRELLYFDKNIPFIPLHFKNMLSTKIVPPPSTVAVVAVKLDSFPLSFASPLSLTVSICSPGMTSLILVCSSHNLRTIAANVSQDQWGFRRIQETSVEALEPGQYEVGKSLISNFSARAGYDMDFIYVVDR